MAGRVPTRAGRPGVRSATGLRKEPGRRGLLPATHRSRQAAGHAGDRLVDGRAEPLHGVVTGVAETIGGVVDRATDALDRVVDGAADAFHGVVDRAADVVDGVAGGGAGAFHGVVHGALGQTGRVAALAGRAAGLSAAARCAAMSGPMALRSGSRAGFAGTAL